MLSTSVASSVRVDSNRETSSRNFWCVSACSCTAVASAAAMAARADSSACATTAAASASLSRFVWSTNFWASRSVRWSVSSDSAAASAEAAAAPSSTTAAAGAARLSRSSCAIRSLAWRSRSFSCRTCSWSPSASWAALSRYSSTSSTLYPLRPRRNSTVRRVSRIDAGACELSMGIKLSYPFLPVQAWFSAPQNLEHQDVAHQNHDQKRPVETTHRPDHSAHRGEHGVDGPVEEVLEPGQGRPGLNPEPAQNGVREHDRPHV